MAFSETFDFAGPAGRLEAVLMLPPQPPAVAAVVCHAHPLHGGVMHYKLIFRVAKALQARGAAVLRFNFRGVGRSQGQHDHGRGEQDDARAALDEMERRFPGLPQLLGGFSFGSLVALRVGAAHPRVRALLALGLPLRLEAGEFLSTVTKPRLFVQGEHDEFGSGQAVGELVARLPEPKSLVVVPGADHFFSGLLEPVQQAIESWAAQRPWETP